MVSPKQKSFFYGQLATLIESGITLTETFSMLEDKALGRELSIAASKANLALSTGEDFLTALEKFSDVFSPFEIGLLRIGFESGSQVAQMRLLEKWFLKIQRVHWEIRREVSMPIVLLVLAYVIVHLKLLFLENWSVFFWQGIYPALAFIAFILFLYLIFSWKYGQSGIEQGLGLHIPFLAAPIKKLLISRFLLAYGSLLESGVVYPKTLTLAAESAGKGFLEKAIDDIIASVDEGKSISYGFAQTRLFPSSIIQLIATGEKTGNISEMARKGAEMLEEEGELRLHGVFRIFSLLFYLGVVAYIVYEIFIYWSEHLQAITNL